AGLFFFCLVSTIFSACHARPEHESSNEATEKAVVAHDGAIRLTPEQMRASGIKTVAVVEQEVAATLSAVGRVRARAGGEAKIFSPFAGRLIADPARLPRVGSVVGKGRVIAEVEQLLTTAEQAQLSGTAAQFGATAAQLESEINKAQQEAAFRQ